MIKTLFSTPSAATLAIREHQIAERDLLHATSQLEYYQAIVPMLDARVKRLDRMLVNDDRQFASATRHETTKSRIATVR